MFCYVFVVYVCRCARVIMMSHTHTRNINRPEGLDTSSLYPVESSVYTDPFTGESVKVPCFVPGRDVEVQAVQCPSPFVSPTLEETSQDCIKTCKQFLLSAVCNPEINKPTNIVSLPQVQSKLTM
jgi:hypothetical protein